MIVITTHNSAAGGGEGHVAELASICQQLGLEYAVLGHRATGGLETLDRFHMADLRLPGVRDALGRAQLIHLNGGPRDLPIAVWARLRSDAQVVLQLHVAMPPRPPFGLRALVTHGALWIMARFLAHRAIRVSSRQAVPARHCATVPPLTNLERLGRRARTSDAKRGEAFLALFCGRAPGADEKSDAKGWLKSIDLVVHLARYYSPLNVLHVGDGSLVPTMRDRCAAGGLQFEQHPWCPNPFGRAAAFTGVTCQFQLSRSEAYGLSVLEAQYVGIPSVISDAVPPDAVMAHDLCLTISDRIDPDRRAEEVARFLRGPFDTDRSRALIKRSQDQARDYYKSLFLDAASNRQLHYSRQSFRYVPQRR